MKTRLLLIAVASLVATTTGHSLSTTWASVGGMTLESEFTLNPAYHDGASYYGAFSQPITVEDATGIFAGTVGDTVELNTPLVHYGNATPIVWNVGGFTIQTLYTIIAGPDFAEGVGSGVNISGNGFDPLAFGVPPYIGVSAGWSFDAPPHGFPTEEISAPVTIFLQTAYVSQIPDTGSTLWLMSPTLILLLLYWWLRLRRA